MYVVSKNRTFLFVAEIRGGRPTKACRVTASPIPQYAPNWLRDLPAYQRAAVAKEIREVVGYAPEPEPEATEPEAEESPA
jgi:hypothetical protein